jgi:hypothetical protein
MVVITLPSGRFPESAFVLLIFPNAPGDGWRYESDIRVDQECTTLMTEIDAAYRNVLAQLPAHDIKEIEWFD